MVLICSSCKQEFCKNHIGGHNCGYTTSFSEPSFAQFQQQYQQQYQEQINQTIKPTPEMYEQHLRANPQVLTTGRESLDLLAALGLLFLVFGLRPILFDENGMNRALLLTITIAPAFILHELAHKYAAMYYGKYARFTLVRQMTMITILVAFLGFGVAGPGATMIMGRSNKKETGIFSAAGPGVNLLLAIISFGLIFILPEFYIFGVTIYQVLQLSMYINSFLALFNLIPVSLLDGRKIFKWNVAVWIGLVLSNIYLFIISSSIISQVF